MGFESVAAGPLVRSSYHAEQTLARRPRRADAVQPAARGRAAAWALLRWRRCRSRGAAPHPAAAGTRWPRALVARRRALRTEVAPARIGRSSTWSAARRAGERRHHARSSATTSERPLAAPAPDADRAEPHRRLGRTGAGCTCTAATRRPSGQPALLRYRPATRPLAATAARRRRRARARGRGDRRPAVRRGRGERLRLAALARDLRLRPPALVDGRPELPGPGAQPHDRRRLGRPLLRARRPRQPATTRGRALQPAPARWQSAAARCASRARRDRRGAPARGRIVVFGGEDFEPGARRSPRSSCTTSAPRRRRLPDMRTPRHGLGGVRWRTASSRSRAALSRASTSRTRSRRSRRPLSRDPAQGRHPDAPLPDPDRRDHRDQRVSSTSSSSRAPGTSDDAATSGCVEYGAIPYEITHPGDRGDVSAGGRRRSSARAGRRWPGGRSGALVAHDLHVDVHARQPAAPGREHAVPVDLREQHRGLDGTAALRRLLPARRDRGLRLADG